MSLSDLEARVSREEARLGDIQARLNIVEEVGESERGTVEQAVALAAATEEAAKYRLERDEVGFFLFFTSLGEYFNPMCDFFLYAL